MLFPAAALGQVALDGNRLVLPETVAFGSGSATLAPSSDAAVTAVAAYLAEKAYITALRVEGHVAGRPNSQELSEARAMAVARALVEKGVDCHRLVAVGFGDTKPAGAPGEAANTRVEFVNAALRGHLIGGMPADGYGQVAGDPCASE